MIKGASAFVLFLACVSNSAFAVPILLGPQDSATGILGLEIDGALFDVTFSEDETSYEDFYGSDTPTFLGDSSDLSAPTAAAASVGDFLNANSVTGLAGFGTITPGAEVFILFIPSFITPFGGPDQISAVNIVFRDGIWDSGSQGRTGSQATLTGLGWVRFQPVAVPEPGTLALLSIGLFGMGLAKRKKKA